MDYITSANSIQQSLVGDWSVKGFIDTSENIYSISHDTKVISKIIELMMTPLLKKFAEDNGLEMYLSEQQNHYPDVTFINKRKNKIALDIKSTYRKDLTNVSGFTLGAFTGYFRNRQSKKNITFPYNEYSKHYILGAIYTRQDNALANQVYPLKFINQIPSAIKNLDFIVQEKYKIAKDIPGSGNTKNIGSCIKIIELKKGTGPFSKLGVKVFDDYWCNYYTSDMAKQEGLTKPPYSNIKQFLKTREQ